MLGMAACASLGLELEPRSTPLNGEFNAREYAAPAPKAFSVVLSTFEEMGYTVFESDEAAGLIWARGKYLAAWDIPGERPRAKPVSEELLYVRADLESIAPERTRVQMVMARISTYDSEPGDVQNKDGTTAAAPAAEFTTLLRPRIFQMFFERLDAAFSAPQHSP